MRILSQRLRVPPSGAETYDAATDRLKPGMKTPGGAFQLLIASRKFPWKCRAGVRGGVRVERDGPRDAADRWAVLARYMYDNPTTRTSGICWGKMQNAPLEIIRRGVELHVRRWMRWRSLRKKQLQPLPVRRKIRFGVSSKYRHAVRPFRSLLNSHWASRNGQKASVLVGETIDAWEATEGGKLRRAPQLFHNLYNAH